METIKAKINSKYVLLVLGLLILYSVAGLAAREALLDKSRPFPSWTYESSNSWLNIWTSWDSGFYYDLAQNGYPQIEDGIKVAYITIPQNRWLKVYTGGGLLGDSRFPLPFSGPNEQVSNTIFVFGRSFNDERLPIFHGYEGIPYCLFDGPVDYTRDVKVAREALVNPAACGNSSCDKSYVTYYSMEAKSVVYQEYFAPAAIDPVRTYGTARPLGLENNIYMGFGCDTVEQDDIQTAKSLDYKNQFTNISFGPLYPWLSKGASVVVGDVVLSGLIISLLFYILSAVFFHKLAVQFLSEKSATLSLLLYILMPFAFFNYAFLPVSLFNFLFFAVLYYAVTKRYFWSILLTPLLVLTSLYGIFVLAPLWVVYTAKDRQNVRSLSIVSYVLNVFAALFGLFVNAWLVYQITHDSFALITARMPWWGGAQSFIGGFITYLMQISPYKLLEILFFVVALGVLISFYYLKSFENKLLNELSLSCAIMFGLIGLLGGGLTGITKYYAIGFPVFFYLARLSERSSKSVKTLALLGFLMGLLFMVCWTISSRLVV